MAKVDPRNFLINTDYEMDKIIYARKIKRTISTNQTTINIKHNLATVPLVFGVWALNENMNNAREFINGRLPEGVYCFATANKTNIILHLNPKQENGSPVSTTFYIYVFGFEPSDNPSFSDPTDPKLSGKKLPTTSKNAKTFILNTDYNYLKLLSNQPKFSSFDPNTGSREFKHGLGYIPMIMSWATFGWSDLGSGLDIEFQQSNYFSYSDSFKSGFFANNNKVIYYGSGIAPMMPDVRIYADEA